MASPGSPNGAPPPLGGGKERAGLPNRRGQFDVPVADETVEHDLPVAHFCIR